LAGALMVPLFTLFADLGLRFLIQGFLAVMLGGIGTFEGPVIGAAAIGVMTAAFPWFLNPVLADVLVFVVAIIIVKLKPGGLLSRRSA
ncbi:MAG: branched-chain amino acid ABC transporter permease, partial [Candidatus Tectomicrobia bacterium]